MKKKVLVVALVIALIAIAVGGTLAWFMDTDEVKNVFTIGSIEINQVEDFVQESQLIPVVGTDPADTTDNYIKKNVTVENLGKNDAYVQTYVAVPQVLDENGIVKLYTGDLTKKGWTAVDGNAEADGIQPVATGVSNAQFSDEADGLAEADEKYNVYLFRYNTALAKKDGETIDVTTACLEYVYIDSAIDLNTYDTNNDQVTDKAYFVVKDADGNDQEIKEFDATGKLNVYVATQGVQARGFSSAKEALESAFTKHPWEE